MNLFFQKHHRLLFYGTWLVLAMAQSASTQLLADEAYYWVYSKYPAWGYFDHPPMIAILIKTGYSFFQNELGVRLLCAIMSTMTILITETFTGKRNPFLYYTIVLGIGVLQIGGFLAVPDTPLLFFTAVFFYCYKKFLQNDGWKNTLLLAFSIAFLFYTKYHGLLIVFFIYLSNPKLVTRRKSWFVVVMVILFYTPHLVWQFSHGWVSFRYHLFESNVSGYKFSYTTDYLFGQLLLTGPLVGFTLLPAALMYRSINPFERAMKFSLVGIFSIFLLSSFRGKVEPNWTMPVLIPLIVLSHQFILEKISWIRPLRILSVFSLLLIVAGRVYLAIDIGPENSTKNRFHKHRGWAKAIVSKTGTTPVVFYNSYQRASLFWFYTGVPSHSHNWYGERRSNYNFWPTEINLLGKPVFLADVNDINSFTDSVQTKKGNVGLTYDPTYSALGAIKIVPQLKNIVVGQNQKTSIKCEINLGYRYGMYLDQSRNLKTSVMAGIFSGKNMIKEFETGLSAQRIFGLWNFELPLNLENIPPGKYDLRFGIASKFYPVTHNSEKIGLEIR